MSRVTSVIFLIPDAVKAALEAQGQTGGSDLADVVVNTGPVLGKKDPEKWIVIQEPEVEREPHLLSGRILGTHKEDGAVKVLAQVSSVAGGEDVIVAARAKMSDIVAEIEAALGVDPTLGGIVQLSYVAAIREVDQGIDEVGVASAHWMTYELTLGFSVHVNPGGTP